MTDRASSVAFNEAAPQAEQAQAMTELQKSHTPSAMSDLLPREDVQRVIDHIIDSFAEQQLMMKGTQLVPFPSKAAKSGDRGMQSVRLDDWALSVQGDYWERPSALGFDSMRAMVEQTPVLNAVVMTRVRQVQRFCKIADGNDTPGFEIRHIDRNHEISDAEVESIRLLNRFIVNCGWEFNPRKRKALRRDSFGNFMAKAVRDSLTMDSCAIETEWKRNKALGIDGFYAVDGATIRLCTEQGYRGDDEIFALQVVQGRISTPYTFENLIYEPRNPRTDVLACGYGLSEVELLVRVVTGFLNAMTYNIKGFDSNAIPKGMLHLSGNYTSADVDAFKRYWNALVKGINNQWSLPVMVSKDQESRASFEKFGVEFNEMYFSKWMTFLTSVICAIYGMSPAEINFDSFTAGSTSALSGSDTTEKLAASKDSGLRPLLSYFEGLITDYIVSEFGDQYAFRWTGLDPADRDKRHEMRKLVLTVNEARAEEGYKAMPGKIGDAPLNSALLGTWQQMQQAQEQGDDDDDGADYGDPVDNGQPGQPGQQDKGGDGQDPGQGGEPGQDNDGQEAGQRGMPGQPGQPGQEGDDQADKSNRVSPQGKAEHVDDDEEHEFGKAFGAPVYVIGG